MRIRRLGLSATSKLLTKSRPLLELLGICNLSRKCENHFVVIVVSPDDFLSNVLAIIHAGRACCRLRFSGSEFTSPLRSTYSNWKTFLTLVTKLEPFYNRHETTIASVERIMETLLTALNLKDDLMTRMFSACR